MSFFISSQKVKLTSLYIQLYSIMRKITFLFCFLSALFFLKLPAHADNFFTELSPTGFRSIAGSAIWNKNSNSTIFSYDNQGTDGQNRALLYSKDSYQSDDGFKFTVSFTTASVASHVAHSFSFGIISNETDLSSYQGYNPFGQETSIHSLGINVVPNTSKGIKSGIYFTNGTQATNLDQSGTRASFAAGETTTVVMTIEKGGYWSYRINGVYEASGVLLDGLDLSKPYRVVLYAQGDQSTPSVHAITLEKGYASGERAKGVRGTWTGGNVLEQVKDFKTLDALRVTFTDGASLSAMHHVPHKLLDKIWQGDRDENGNPMNNVAPLWGDLNADLPVDQSFLEKILKIKAAGFKVKAYTNSENFVGSNHAAQYKVFITRWKTYCDTDPKVQAFINSQPYHQGVWNASKKKYEIAYNADGSEKYPDRKYMLCYAEYILKDYALRYGRYFDTWIFDAANTMTGNGDNTSSGLIEEQRIYQAFANAVHAGNPDVPLAFNNGRSTIRYAAFPFAIPTHFDDFTFGHAFGGNNSHAEKPSRFKLNYKHVQRMIDTEGFVHDGGKWTWDDAIVGNLHSKLATTAWKYGPVQAWEEGDFLDWNLNALQAGGAMTWAGSTPKKGKKVLRAWAYDLLKALDDHLATTQYPNSPNWSRAYTPLPKAKAGQAYHHVLVEGKDFWDPESDDITNVISLDDAPAWLNITKDDKNTGHWVLSGTPPMSNVGTHHFVLAAIDTHKHKGERRVEIEVLTNP